LLAEAVAELHLEPGQTYRTTVNGIEVQVHRPATAPAPVPPPRAGESPDEGPSQFADMVMLDLHLNVPPSPKAITVTAERGEPILPPPIVIDESDLAPE
jgi:hypothetical protein